MDKWMKRLNIFGTLVVLVCTIAVSYSHTIELFESAGYRGVLAHMGVIAIETTFLLGAFNIVHARLRGDRPGWPTVAAGAFGLGIVGWSNVSAGWPYGWPGVIIGAAIPVSLFISEANLAMFLRGRRPGRAAEQKAKTAEHVKSNDGQVSGQVAETPGSAGKVADDVTGRQIETADQPAETDGRTDIQPAGQSDSRTEHRPAGQPDNVAEKKSAGRKRKSADQNSGHVLEKAIEEVDRHYREYGEPPSIRGLARKIGCSRYMADRALDEWRARKMAG